MNLKAPLLLQVELSLRGRLSIEKLCPLLLQYKVYQINLPDEYYILRDTPHQKSRAVDNPHNWIPFDDLDDTLYIVAGADHDKHT